MPEKDQKPQEHPDTPMDEDDDPQTAREEFELDLMEADSSEAGEHVGDEAD